MTWTELIQWLTEYFFDSPRHFIELVIIIFASFITFKININHGKNGTI